MPDIPNKLIATLGAMAVALVLGLAFFFAYEGGLHAPKPHKVPFAVIAPEPEAAELSAQLRRASDALAPHAVPDRATAIKQIKEKSIYGALKPAAPAKPGSPSHLYVASARSAIAAEIIEDAVTEIAAKQGQKLVTTDVVALPARDPEGLTPFYLLVASVLAGYISVIMVSAAVGATRFPFRVALRQLGLFLGFAIVFALLVMVIADPVMGTLSGHFWELVLFIALIVAAASAVTLGLMAAFGRIAGFLLAITTLILLGNSSSGGAAPREFLPGFWRDLNEVLPNAAGFNGLVDITYFPDASLTRPLLTLAAWFAGGALLFLILRPQGGSAAQEDD